jgi:hypothetical protein
MSTADFFRARLDSMIDMRHPLALLATRIPPTRTVLAGRWKTRICSAPRWRW